MNTSLNFLKRLQLIKNKWHTRLDIFGLKHYSGKATDNKECTYLDKDTIERLKKLSLINFAPNDEVFQSVDSIIKACSELTTIKIKDLEPLEMILEYVPLTLREDVASEGVSNNKKHSKKAILKNAAVLEGSYFVAPPTNQPADA